VIGQDDLRQKRAVRISVACLHGLVCLGPSKGPYMRGGRKKWKGRESAAVIKGV
jgi:hypothetical protein